MIISDRDTKNVTIIILLIQQVIIAVNQNSSSFLSSTFQRRPYLLHDTKNTRKTTEAVSLQTGISFTSIREAKRQNTSVRTCSSGMLGVATMNSLARQAVPGEARGSGLGRDVSVYGQSVK